MLLIAVTFVIAIYFTGRAFISYRNYQLVQSSDIYIELVHHLDDTVEKLEEERVVSALYLGTKGDTNFQTVAQKRQESDIAIAALQSYIAKHPNLSQIKNSFKDLQENLRYVRSRVDVINSDYSTILFDYYQYKIISPLLHENQKWLRQLAESISSVSYYFTTYAKLIKYRDTLNQEESFIAYILAQKNKMSTSDLMLWENILSEEEIPSLQHLNGKPIYPLLKKTLHENELLASVTQLRRAILKGISTGNYIINNTAWMPNMQRDVQAVTETEKTLFDYLKSLDFKGIVPVALYLNLFIVIVSLVLLFYLLRLYAKPLTVTRQQYQDQNPDIQIKHHTKTVSTKDQVQPPYTERLADTVQRETDAFDLPLTNIETLAEETGSDTEEKTEPNDEVTTDNEEESIEEDTFSPIQLMKDIIKPYIPLAQHNNISFHYAIDPSLPDICIGNPEKIHEMLNLLLDSAMETGNSRKDVTLKIENVAQKKFETVLSFVIRDTSKYISPDEQKKIKKGTSQKHHSLADAFAFYNKDFVKAGQIVKQLGGRLQIQSDQKEGTEFMISLNLKKFISTEY